MCVAFCFTEHVSSSPRSSPRRTAANTNMNNTQTSEGGGGDDAGPTPHKLRSPRGRAAAVAGADNQSTDTKSSGVSGDSGGPVSTISISPKHKGDISSHVGGVFVCVCDHEREEHIICAYMAGCSRQFYVSLLCVSYNNINNEIYRSVSLSVIRNTLSVYGLILTEKHGKYKHSHKINGVKYQNVKLGVDSRYTGLKERPRGRSGYTCMAGQLAGRYHFCLRLVC